jgi:predicted ester cyclase
MSNLDVAKQAFDALEKQDWDAASALMTDDFTFDGPVPQPIDRDGFLGLSKAMAAAMPDWSYQAHDFAEDGDAVTCTVNVGGTHTETLDLAAMGITGVPASGKSARNPDEKITLTIRGDKVAKLHADVPPDGGVAGVLTQIGVTPPG